MPFFKYIEQLIFTAKCFANPKQTINFAKLIHFSERHSKTKVTAVERLTRTVSHTNRQYTHRQSKAEIFRQRTN